MLEKKLWNKLNRYEIYSYNKLYAVCLIFFMASLICAVILGVTLPIQETAWDRSGNIIFGILFLIYSFWVYTIPYTVEKELCDKYLEVKK